MDLYSFYLLLITVSAFVLVIMYTTTLWQNWKGFKFNFIYSIAGILLLNNIALLAFVFASYQQNQSSDVELAYVWLGSLALGISDLTLCVSHIFLALKYR
jgi:hypothetical protein